MIDRWYYLIMPDGTIHRYNHENSRNRALKYKKMAGSEVIKPSHYKVRNAKRNGTVVAHSQKGTRK